MDAMQEEREWNLADEDQKEVFNRTKYWNYRLVGTQDKWGTLWGIFEVYYDDDNNILGRTQDPIAFIGEDTQDVMEAVQRAISDVTNHPPLWYDGHKHYDIPSGPVDPE